MTNRELNKSIAQHTLTILQKGEYVANRHNIIKEDIKFSLEKSELYADTSPHSMAVNRDELLSKGIYYNTTFEVANCTTLEMCQKIVSNDQKIFVLNFASAKNPGGGFLNGATAQEESLARSSSLYPCLLKFQKEFYDFHKRGSAFYSDRMIYSPDVPVFKDDNGELLDTPYKVSFLTSPAVNISGLKGHGKIDYQKVDAVMLKRIEKILTIAYIKGYQTLVLGAWGCGVFGNEVSKVANYFKHYLKNGGMFHGRFKAIHFAILTKDEKVLHLF